MTSCDHYTQALAMMDSVDSTSMQEAHFLVRHLYLQQTPKDTLRRTYLLARASGSLFQGAHSATGLLARICNGPGPLSNHVQARDQRPLFTNFAHLDSSSLYAFSKLQSASPVGIPARLSPLHTKSVLGLAKFARVSSFAALTTAHLRL
jgi:hypothetical protein